MQQSPNKPNRTIKSFSDSDAVSGRRIYGMTRKWLKWAKNQMNRRIRRQKKVDDQ